MLFMLMIAFILMPLDPEYENRPNPGEIARSLSAEQDDMAAILAGCAAYCERLNRAALDFVCRETIREAYYQEGSPGYESDRPKEKIEEIPLPPKIMEYEYDYQLIRKNGEITETRTLLKENGEVKNIKGAPLKTKRFYSMRSIFGPVGILSREQQRQYTFKIIEREDRDGRAVLVIEARPRKKSKDNPNFGQFWIDAGDFSVLKFMVEQESLAGFEKPLNPRIIPHYVVTHYYEIEKNGLRFPSQTVFLENYTYRGSINQRPLKASETTFTFTDYKFFLVDVAVEIKNP